MSVTIYQHANCDKCNSGFCEHAERVMARRKREETIAEECEGVAAPLEPLTVPQICIDCGHEFGVWFADNPVWNAIIPGRVGMLCPCCFIVRAEKRDFETTGWKMVPMDNTLGEQSVEQEPIPLQFVDEFTKHCDGLTEVDKVLMAEIAKAYAAAFSKKAERERDAAVVTLRAMCGDNWQTMGRNFAESLAKIEARESRILELEKEITALRETK